jgi:hypothetical protein
METLVLQGVPRPCPRPYLAAIAIGVQRGDRARQENT